MKKIRCILTVLAAGMILSGVYQTATGTELQVKAMEKSEPAGELQINPDSVQIASDLKDLPYIGDRTYTLFSGWDEEEDHWIEIEEAGILSAGKIDLDEDGTEEILAITYEEGVIAEEDRTLWLSVLKESGGAWNILAEMELAIGCYGVGTMDSGSAFSDISLFLRKYNGKYEIFYEDFYVNKYAAHGRWFIKGYRFENNHLVLIPETDDIFYEGSPLSEVSEEGSEKRFESVKNYRSLGFCHPNIGMDQLTADRNEDLYEVLRLQMGNIFRDGKMSYTWDESDETQGMLWFHIEDSSETVSDGIEEFQGGEKEEALWSQTSDETAASESPAIAGADYILPDSGSRYLLTQEVSHFSPDQIQRGINEIYARHGRVFATEENDAYFRSKSWYQPWAEKTDEQIEAEFNDYEWENVMLLVNLL